MQGEKLFTRELMIMMIIGFCYSATYLLVYICIADYVQKKFEVDAMWGGLAACLFVAGAVVSRLLLARLVDIIGRKRCLMITSVLSSAVCLIYPFMPDYTSLCLLRILNGFFYGLGMLTVNTLVSSAIPKSRRSEGLGYYMLSYTIASAIGPYIGMHFMYGGDVVPVFIIAAILNMIPAFLVWLVTSPYTPPTKEQISAAMRFKINNFIERSALSISIVGMFFFFAYSSVIVFLSEYGNHTGLIWATSNFFIVFAISSLLSRISIGRFADTHGDNSVYIPCLVCLVISFVLIAFADSTWMMLVPAFLLGYCVAVNNAVGQSIAIRESKAERYPICLSTFQIFTDAANGVAPLLFGLIITFAGYRSMYLTAACIAFVALLLYLVLCSDKHANEPARVG